MERLRRWTGKTLKLGALLLKALFIRLFFFDRIRFSSLRVGIEFTSRLKAFGPQARIFLGKDFYLRKHSDIECHNGTIIIGDRVFINKNSTIVARERISIGNDCMFGENLSIYDHDHSFALSETPFREQPFMSRSISIGNNVWVGCKVFIGKGVTIGDNVVVAAGSIVTRDIASNTLFSNTGGRPL